MPGVFCTHSRTVAPSSRSYVSALRGMHLCHRTIVPVPEKPNIAFTELYAKVPAHVYPCQ